MRGASSAAPLFSGGKSISANDAQVLVLQANALVNYVNAVAKSMGNNELA
jgi:hypothetical protein